MSSYRIRVFTAVITLAGLAFVMPAHAGAQKVDRKAQEKLDKEKRQQYALLSEVADQMMAEQAAPTDIKIEWVNEFSLKAQENKSYVPFTINVDAPQASAGPLMMYLRVAQRGAAKPDEPAGGERNGAPAVYTFENVYSVNPKPDAQGRRTVSRAFDAGGGEYDVYIVLAERKANGKDTALGRVGTLKQPVSVPDYWSADLVASPVLLVDRIDQVNPPLNQEQQTERPFALGGMELMPADDSVFGKKEELFPVFFVYNVGVTESGKPDLEVEYHFHQKVAEGEKFFNRTNPQAVNESTLPPQFDVRAGHQVMIAQAVPLGSFPEGDYRLEIKLTDKLSGKSLSKDVPFTVAP